MLACHVKCDACPVKFEARKHFIREGAYFTVGTGFWVLVTYCGLRVTGYKFRLLLDNFHFQTHLWPVFLS